MAIVFVITTMCLENTRGTLAMYYCIHFLLHYPSLQLIMVILIANNHRLL